MNKRLTSITYLPYHVTLARAAGLSSKPQAYLLLQLFSALENGERKIDLPAAEYVDYLEISRRSYEGYVKLLISKRFIYLVGGNGAPKEILLSDKARYYCGKGSAWRPGHPEPVFAPEIQLNPEVKEGAQNLRTPAQNLRRVAQNLRTPYLINIYNNSNKGNCVLKADEIAQILNAKEEEKAELYKLPATKSLVGCVPVALDMIEFKLSRLHQVEAFLVQLHRPAELWPLYIKYFSSHLYETWLHEDQRNQMCFESVKRKMNALNVDNFEQLQEQGLVLKHFHAWAKKKSPEQIKSYGKGKAYKNTAGRGNDSARKMVGPTYRPAGRGPAQTGINPEWE